MSIGLRFAPETGAHASRMRSSIFRNVAGRYVLNLTTERGANGQREFDTMADAMNGTREFYAELDAPSPTEHVIAALCPGYAPDTRDSGRVRLCAGTLPLVHEDMVERVALAIESTMFAPHELPLDRELHGKYRHTARAAIETMRDPTEKMIAAASRNNHPRDIDTWRTMIAEALS